MARIRVQNGDGEDEDATPDTQDYDITDAQAAIRRKRHTDKVMEHEADIMYANLREYASKLTYVRERRRKP